MALQHPLSDEVVELIARRLRVIAEPTRIKLLDRLRAQEATVQELSNAVGSTQQNVSKHLGVLADAGIVARRREGSSIRRASLPACRRSRTVTQDLESSARERDLREPERVVEIDAAQLGEP